MSTSPKELKRKLTIYLLIKKWNGLPYNKVNKVKTIVYLDFI